MNHLLYAAFYQLHTKESFFEGLAQDVVRERIEIDCVDFVGRLLRVGTAPRSCRLWSTRDLPRLCAFRLRAPLCPPTNFCTTKLLYWHPDTSAM